MTVGSSSTQTRSQNETNQPNIGQGKDSVNAYFASITNPTTQRLHDDDVIRGSANKEDVEKDYSTFCAGMQAGALHMVRTLLFPESPEESINRVWQQYQQLQDKLQQQAEAFSKTRRIA